MKNKSVRAKKRNYLKARLMGAVSICSAHGTDITEEEKELLDEMRGVLRRLLYDYDKNTSRLGFTVKRYALMVDGVHVGVHLTRNRLKECIKEWKEYKPDGQQKIVVQYL